MKLLMPCLLSAAGLLVTASALALSPAEMLQGYSAKAGAAAQPERGRQFFEARHGREWSCSACHGSLPLQPGLHAATGRSIGALAPAANAQRFTDPAKTEKWFRRNCNDVLGRECSAAEKADVLAWLLSLQP